MQLIQDSLAIEFDSASQSLEIYDLWEEGSQIKKAGYAQFSTEWLQNTELEEVFREVGQAVLVRLVSTREILFKEG